MSIPKIKIEVVKTLVVAPTRTLSAEWRISTEDILRPRKKPETLEEEAIEIIRRLKTPPAKPSTLEDEISEELARIIQEEIDRELLGEMLKCQKK